jgi:succinate dehydrogenase/fumarate reductase flavoprotein subunit
MTVSAVAGVPVIEADVLVVGGGVAGCVAAVRAAEAGASVVVLDKVRDIRRSGDAGRGLAFLTTYLDLGEDWDTPETFADWYCTVADGLVDMAVAWPFAIDPLPEVCAHLEESGIPLRTPDGAYDRVGRMWTPGPIVLKFDGTDLKPRLTERAAGTPGVQIVGGVHTTAILTEGGRAGGRAVGAMGFDIRTGEVLAVAAPTTIIATGNAERVIFNSPARDAFNTYHRPYHGATGFALAARAGAAAANLEFLGTFLFPRGFATGAMGNLLEAGGRLVNGNGELVVDRPDVGERSFGFGMVAQAAREVLAGRGPLYVDCTHLDAAAIDRLRSYIHYDAPLFLEFLEQSGIDLSRHPVEFELFNGTWSATASPKGIVVDGQGRTEVPGLYAAGDIATPAYALAGSLTAGWVAGRSAAEEAVGAGRTPLPADAVGEERARIREPLERRGGTSWSRFERELQDVMTRYVGLSRNAGGLAQAAQDLSGLAAVEATVAAANPHELMRAHEAFDLRCFDRLMTAAAAARDESRFGFLLGHHRSDHPDPDDARWRGVANVARLVDGEPSVEQVVPTPEWREQALAGTATPVVTGVGGVG